MCGQSSRVDDSRLLIVEQQSFGASAPSSNLQILQQQFPGLIALNARQLGAILGGSWKHIANASAAGKYPIRSIQVGGKRVFPILDIAAFLDAGRRRPGRPTKAEQIRRRAGGRS